MANLDLAVLLTKDNSLSPLLENSGDFFVLRPYLHYRPHDFVAANLKKIGGEVYGRKCNRHSKPGN